MKALTSILLTTSFCREKEKENLTNIVQITNHDCLRYVECLVSDSVIDHYRQSQKSLTIRELNGRNLAQREPTFHEVIVSVFNNEGFCPFPTAYPMLHNDFVGKVQIDPHCG